MIDDRTARYNAIQARLQADHQTIVDFKLELTTAGFDIIPAKKWQTAPYTYFSCHKNGRFLYIQKNSLTEGWSISSLYIPSKDHGSGKQLTDCNSLTVPAIESALAMSQSFNSDRYPRPNDVRFYRDLAHYLQLHQADFNQP